MNIPLPQERLEAVFDRVAREVTREATGICLYEGDIEPSGTLCTVYSEFRRGVDTSISLCADAALFVRLAQGMMQREDVTQKDVEEYSKEYFNILCGHIAAGVHQETHVSPWFTPPEFYYGRYHPHGREIQFSLHYKSDAAENALLIHHTVRMYPEEPEDPSGPARNSGET